MSTTSAIGFLFALALPVAPAQTSTSEPITVYVAAAQEPDRGFTDEASLTAVKRRDASLQDLKEAFRKKRGLRVVDDPQEAEISVELTWRSSAGWNIFSADQGGPLLLQAILTAGTYTLGITGKPAPLRPGWRGAATDIANQVEKWVQLNHARLLEQRRKQ